MLIVIVVIGIMAAMLADRMQWHRAHIDLALTTQAREESWGQSVLRMRQWRTYDQAQITLSSTWVETIYSGWILSWGSMTTTFAKPVEVAVTTLTGQSVWSLSRSMLSYGISCEGPGSGSLIRLSQGTMRACYMVDTTTCVLHRRVCN